MTTESAPSTLYRVGSYHLISTGIFFVTWAQIEENGMVTLIQCNTGQDDARILGFLYADEIVALADAVHEVEA